MLGAQTRADISREVCEITQNVMNLREKVQEVNHLENSLGMDSIDRVELAVEIEECFMIDLPDCFESTAQTVKDFVDKIEELVG